MDLSEKIMPPAAMYHITGQKADAFRNQKSRGFYEGFGIVADGESGKFSRYSVFQISAVAASLKANGLGVELREAARAVAMIFPHFSEIVEKAKRVAAAANADFAATADINQPYQVPAHWAFSACFILGKVPDDEGDGEHWSIWEFDGSRPMQEQMALLGAVIVLDVGRIIGSVIGRLIEGGAMSATEV